MLTIRAVALLLLCTTSNSKLTINDNLKEEIQDFGVQSLHKCYENCKSIDHCVSFTVCNMNGSCKLHTVEAVSDTEIHVLLERGGIHVMTITKTQHRNMKPFFDKVKVKFTKTGDKMTFRLSNKKWKKFLAYQTKVEQSKEKKEEEEEEMTYYLDGSGNYVTKISWKMWAKIRKNNGLANIKPKLKSVRYTDGVYTVKFKPSQWAIFQSNLESISKIAKRPIRKAKTKPCRKGRYMRNGYCYKCPKNMYSPGGKSKHCKRCPKGTTVASGKGKSKKSCKRESCKPGYFLNRHNGCQSCPENTFSVGNEQKRCRKCPVGSIVAAGRGTKKGDCNWEPCRVGHYFTKNEGCKPCCIDSYSSGGWTSSCSSCPLGKGVKKGTGARSSDCTWKPCVGGYYLDPNSGCQVCPADTYNPGGFRPGCTKCPTGMGVAPGFGTAITDCTWKSCSPGHYRDRGCKECPSGSYSPGGILERCTMCPAGTTSMRGRAATVADCFSESCRGGYYLNPTRSCTPCEMDTHSPGGSSTACRKCPAGKGVPKGQGKGQSDCAWKKCPEGYILDEVRGCVSRNQVATMYKNLYELYDLLTRKKNN